MLLVLKKKQLLFYKWKSQLIYCYYVFPSWRRAVTSRFFLLGWSTCVSSMHKKILNVKCFHVNLKAIGVLIIEVLSQCVTWYIFCLYRIIIMPIAYGFNISDIDLWGLCVALELIILMEDFKYFLFQKSWTILNLN